MSMNDYLCMILAEELGLLLLLPEALYVSPGFSVENFRIWSARCIYALRNM
jgi:hypothetical protein